MALVKRTQIVKDKILNNIDKLFQDRLKYANELRGITELEIAELVYKLTHTPERLVAIEDLESTYRGFSIAGDSHDFRFEVMVKREGAKPFEREISVKFASPKKSINAFVSSWGNAPIVKNLPVEVTGPILDAQNRYELVQAEVTDFKKKFEDVWNKVRSVNELVKLWPAVTDLLPKDIIERLNRKDARSKKEEEESLDVASLNVALLKAKVAK